MAGIGIPSFDINTAYCKLMVFTTLFYELHVRMRNNLLVWF